MDQKEEEKSSSHCRMLGKDLYILDTLRIFEFDGRKKKKDTFLENMKRIILTATPYVVLLVTSIQRYDSNVRRIITLFRKISGEDALK